MNKIFKPALVAVVIVGFGGYAWLMYAKQGAERAAVVTKIQDVTSTTPVQAIKGKEVSMTLTNHQTSLVQVTIPGVNNTPQPVQVGATAQITAVPTAPGTYPIIETTTVTNTRSIEGGTEPAQYEVGHIVVTAN